MLMLVLIIQESYIGVLRLVREMFNPNNYLMNYINVCFGVSLLFDNTRR
jgi:hypothetical protein